jgi:two-component system, OmpR family, phosphate regulon sensor histidine kinase PhoR
MFGTRLCYAKTNRKERRIPSFYNSFTMLGMALSGRSAIDVDKTNPPSVAIKIMTSSARWFIHPILVFILSVVAMATSLVLYIYWYLKVSTGLQRIVMAYKLNEEGIFEFKTWVVILVLSILVGLIIVGVLIIFVYYQKTWRIYRLQRNFIDSFTHELKTPVTSLKLYLETFSRHELPREDQLKYIGFMLNDVDRLLDNINRILQLARIESGNYAREFVQEDLVEAVKRFRDENADLFPEGMVTIENPAGRPFPFRLNVQLFDVLLMNLCSNAMRYNDSPRPRLNIRFVPHPEGLVIRFEDNGIGIEHKELGKIFRKFYRAGKPDDLTTRGSGVGLYLVKQIARLHKIRIHAESDGLDKGSVFVMSLRRPKGVDWAGSEST